MSPLLLVAALLPGLYWDQPADTAGEVKKAGVQRLYVPPEAQDAWRKLGFTVVAFDPARLPVVKLPAPGVQYRVNVASATRSPWVDANGWRFQRDGGRVYYYGTLPKGRTPLAAAEAHMYARDAVLRAPPDELASFGKMLEFLKRIERPPLPAMANIGVIDDGSDALGEVMNLLARRNLLFRVVLAADPKYDLTVGRSPEADRDPNAFVADLRQKLGDEKRLLRIYGSDVVLGRLTAEGGRARLYLLNYGQRPVSGIRVRVRGAYKSAKLAAFGTERDILDFETRDGATEFTIPDLPLYAVVDLE